MSILPKSICRINESQIGFFLEFGKLILKYVWRFFLTNQTNKQKDLAQISLKKKNKVRGLTLSDFKSCEAARIRTLWYYWHKDRHMDQWKRIEDQLIFDRGSRDI